MTNPRFNLRRFTFTLLPSETKNFEINGDKLLILESNMRFNLSVDAAVPLLMERGLKLQGYEYNTLRLENLSLTVSLSVTIVAGFGDIEDWRSRPQVPVRSVSLYAAVIGAFTTSATATLLEAANEDRCEITMIAGNANLTNITCCCEQAGFRVIGQALAGQVYRFQYKGPLWLFGPTAADVATVFASYYN